MVDVAQLVELRIVDPAVVGSNPIVHPNSFIWKAPEGAECRGLLFSSVAGLRPNRQTMKNAPLSRS